LYLQYGFEETIYCLVYCLLQNLMMRIVSTISSVSDLRLEHDGGMMKRATEGIGGREDENEKVRWVGGWVVGGRERNGHHETY
jgi:hypothetical protein